MKASIKNLFLLPVLTSSLYLIMAGRMAAQTFTNLYSFNDGGNGGYLYAGLVLSCNTLYGTTYEGGYSPGDGTVFAINTDGTDFTNLYRFTTPSSAENTNRDGFSPHAGLIVSGNTLYGTASSGGEYGNGTVFAVNTNGIGFTNLYSFMARSGPYIPGQPPPTNSDGAFPVAGLILSGNTLYGTASSGGEYGNGTVFAIDTDGSGFTNLHSFTAHGSGLGTNRDGANPVAGLILTDNTLYGTAVAGGSAGYGTVFSVNIDGTDFTNLHSFTYSDGILPQAGLILSSNTLYGTAEEGGKHGSYEDNAGGTVFKVYTDGGGFAVLHNFTATSGSEGSIGTNSDGNGPFAGLILAGNILYGTATFGGNSGYGTVFSINTDGTGFTNLHSFTDGDDGGNPNAGLILSSNTLYGTTLGGGNSGWGTVFSLSLAQGSLQVIILPASAITAGAQWQVDGGMLQNSGAIVAGLTSGSHTLSFTTVCDYKAPANQTVKIGAGTTNTATGNYTQVQEEKPTLTVVSPKSGLKVTNDIFAAFGTTKSNNVAVAVAYYQLNGGDWLPAISGNAWTDWSATNLTLIPGTNVFSAYAVDSCGNVSKTNTVKLVYILTAPLNVEIVGEGTLTPDDNGKQLVIGDNYTLKAKGTNGCAFDYWSGSVPMSDDSTLTFTMASNLTIIVNFKDVTKPVATLTFPIKNQKWSNTVITVTGTAKDNVGVTDVGVQINNGGWTEPETGNDFTNWSAANLPVIFGTNTVQTYAVDGAGNVSPTNEVKFIGIVAPASLAGYEATLKPSVGKQEIIVSWGDGTSAQVGADNDTNANDYSAGSYTYMQTGPNTALLTNVDIGMMSEFGTTNVTTLNLTFTSITSGNYAWTNENDSGSGTMTLSPVSNLVPATLAGKTFTARNSEFAFAGDGTFNESKNGGVAGNGTYSFTQYSPTVAMLELNWTDANDAGDVAYVELTFTSSTNVNVAQSWYSSPSFGSDPGDWGLATGTIK